MKSKESKTQAYLCARGNINAHLSGLLSFVSHVCEDNKFSQLHYLLFQVYFLL